MKDPRQFGAHKPAVGMQPPGPLDCSAVELWLAESAEKALPPEVAERIDAHATGCMVCREKLAQVLHGREWLLVLKQEFIEPPAGLVAKILARTSSAGAPGAMGMIATDSERAVLDVVRDDDAGESRVSAKKISGGKWGRSNKEDAYVPVDDSAAASIPAWQQSSVVVLRRTFLEPRLALVAAMAFFSITLTMNLLGVRFTGMHATDLAPKNLHRTVTRQYAEANARVVRYYENLRIVYEVEARVQQLRRAAETSAPAGQESKPRKQSSNSNGDSSNRSEGPHRGSLADNPLSKENRHAVPPALPDPKPVVTGPRLNAAVRWPLGASSSVRVSFAKNVAVSSEPRDPWLRSGRQAFSIDTSKNCFSMRYFSTRERRLA